ncbi:hypothetical protein BC629DRAFT_458087 [Irpex lacteus]|nr:hypothetical protein BC629DRAFT_458087 [Irpex lacteus]
MLSYVCFQAYILYTHGTGRDVPPFYFTEHWQLVGSRFVTSPSTRYTPVLVSVGARQLVTGLPGESTLAAWTCGSKPWKSPMPIGERGNGNDLTPLPTKTAFTYRSPVPVLVSHELASTIKALNFCSGPHSVSLPLPLPIHRHHEVHPVSFGRSLRCR